MGIVNIKNLIHDYRDEEENETVRAIDNVSLQIEAGQFIVILGHNGSGKSSLAKHINALLMPTEGTVWVDGIETTNNKRIWDIRQTAGMVFQNPDNQIVCTIVEEDVAFGPENLGIPPAEIRRRVDDALAAVGMSEFKSAAPHRLSGGQKQRIALAGILAMEPECILLDEPTAMLDPLGRREVLNAITNLNREKGITIVLITHFMEEAAAADRVIVMDHGQITADGSPTEIFADFETLQRAGLALPQTGQLLRGLREKGFAVNTGLISPEDTAREIFRVVAGGEMA